MLRTSRGPTASRRWSTPPAGVVDVAATAAAIARQERQRRAYTPEEIRTRLHERYAESDE